MSQAGDIETKLKSYEAGIDLFYQTEVKPQKLCASITNLINKFQRLKHSQANTSANNVWTLHPSRWHLMSPSSGHIALTQKEKKFLMELMMANQKTVSRTRLLKGLGYEARGLHGRKALDVMGIRLRKKIKQRTGNEAPIKTIYQEGFQLNAAHAVKLKPKNAVTRNIRQDNIHNFISRLISDTSGLNF